MEMFTVEHNGRVFATAEARIVSAPDEIPVEMAMSLPDEKLNDSYLWIAGRFVQAGRTNANGHFWQDEDLEHGNSSIKHTPMNLLHQFARPVGVFVDSQIVAPAEETAAKGVTNEIQALGVVWAGNFPQIANEVREHHEAGNLWFSMECVAEEKACLDCGEVFPWATARQLTCEHMRASAAAPRRLINPTFVGGALIYPPEKPAWKDADVTEMARELVIEYADADYSTTEDKYSIDEWTSLMDLIST